ncbi:Ig-like domain-containing protein [Pantoea endophytica]|uniref:Ig-like domain-containing protein n=1 Tax=Pantoea endophytica TaxID=92488 RepID=UPI0024138612|nr:Ig-like domain-containing protein [Pantoea endophytica]
MKPTNHKWTTNPQIPFGGTRENDKGSVMEIVLNGMVYTTLIDITTGKWSWIPELPLADGAYTVSTRVIDKAGNGNAPVQLILHVDTTAPDKPDILRVVDDEGLQQSWLTPGAKTDDKTPTLSGSAEAGSIVRLYNGSDEIGSARADQNGHWEITPITELPNGAYSFTVTSTDPMGHTSAASDAFSLTIEKDSLPPIGDGAIITHASDNVGSATGTLLDGAITDDTTPTLSGTAPAGSTVRIQYRADNGKWVEGGNATLNGNDWTWTPSPILAEGKYEFRANAGNGWSDEFQLSIETNAESSVEITYAIDDVAPWTGRLEANAITDDRSPELHGIAEANSKVFLFYRNIANNTWILLGEAVANADSHWSLETSDLPVGSFIFKATTVNDSSSEGAIFDLTIIEKASYIPTIDRVWDDYGMINGEVKHGGKTDDTRPEFSGKAESNSIVEIEYTQKGGSWQVLGSAITDAKGHWLFTPPNELDYAEWSFRVKNSNNNSYSDEFSFIIESTDLMDTIYDFEKFDKGALPSVWKYDDLTFKLVSENINIEIIETEETGNLLAINHPQVSMDKHSEVTIEFKDNVNYFELQTYDWGNADSYVAFFDNKGIELGRRYSEHYKDKEFGKLNFYRENNDISYVKIMTKGRSTQFGIDNIITKKNYIIDSSEISSGVEYFQDALNNDYLPNLGTFKYNSGLTITHTSGVDGSYYVTNEKTQNWAFGLRNNSSYRIDVESPTSALSLKTGRIVALGHKVNYYSEEGIVLHSEFLAVSESYQTYGYVAKPGEKISYAIITTVDNKSPIRNTGNFNLDTIKWGVDAQYDPNIKDSLVKGYESFGNLKDIANDIYLPDLSGPITFSSGLTFTHLAGLDSATVRDDGNKLGLRNDSSYKFDFGSNGKTTDISFDLGRVEIGNIHEIIVYSTYGEQLYRTSVSASEGPDAAKNYRYVAAEGKFISHFVIMTKDDTLPEKPNGGIYIDNIKWGSEIETLSTEFDNKPYKFINEYEVSVNEHGTTLDLSTLLASSAKTNSVTLNDFDQNTLLIEAPDLLDNTLVGFFIDDNHHQLMVKGDKDDVVKLSDISPEGDTAEWSQQHGSLTIAGVEYQVFTALNHDTEVLVQQGIKAELI